MAKIPDGTFKDWQDTQTINAAEYKQEREIIRIAINDTEDTKLDKTGNLEGTWQGFSPLEVAEGINSQRIDDLESSKAGKNQGLWTFAVTQNGWGDLNGAIYGVASYRKNQMNYVELRGLLSGGQTSDGTTLLTLPDGYRPTKSLVFVTSTNDGTNDYAARVHVEPDGKVAAYKAKLNHLSLSGITFSVE